MSEHDVNVDFTEVAVLNRMSHRTETKPGLNQQVTYRCGVCRY